MGEADRERIPEAQRRLKDNTQRAPRIEHLMAAGLPLSPDPRLLKVDTKLEEMVSTEAGCTVGFIDVHATVSGRILRLETAKEGGYFLWIEKCA